ncbi:MAG: hypothetical protein MJ244_02325 [Clostridia bacterium]|nr:hypothetical protein [Clostridia bacterium]
MSEKVLNGRSLKVKYGISHEDGKLRFTFCGVDEIPKEAEEVPLIFKDVLDIANVIQGFTSLEVIEYQQKEVFSLEACMCAYLIDYIKSGNDMSHITEENLINIYNSPVVNEAFENIGYEATQARSKDEFFELESKGLSIVHEAFKANEESYHLNDPKEDEEKAKVVLPSEEKADDELDGDALDEILKNSSKLTKQLSEEIEEEQNVKKVDLFNPNINTDLKH